jgi:hypothetical protein
MAPIFNVRRHAGSEFESGAVHRARGINEAVPGVDVVDGREEERSWAGGNSNFSESDGRRRKLRDTPASKTVVVQGKGQITVFKGTKATEDERWVWITEVKENGTKSKTYVGSGVTAVLYVRCFVTAVCWL